MPKKDENNKKPPKKRTGRLSARKKKLLKLISDNLGNLKKGEKTRSMYDMMLEAGYSESSAKQQSATLAGIKEEAKGIVEKLVDARDQALDLLPEKVQKASYSELVSGVDRFTKSIELLSGRPTERTSHILTDEEKQELDELLEE